MWDDDRYPPYVPVAERKRQAEGIIAKLRKKGVAVAPVTLSGSTIARTFWGRAWCRNLESYGDYRNRLPRGQSYVRSGAVIHLEIGPKRIAALVSGSEVYEVAIAILALPAPEWESIRQDCAGGIDSLVSLLQGRLSEAVMDRLCRQQNGLFPRPKQIMFKCSCPDAAHMCKHVAAVLYGVGARLDAEPALLFRLRDVHEQELIAQAGGDLPIAAAAPAAGRLLKVDDLSALFGIDISIAATAPSVPSEPASTRKRPKLAKSNKAADRTPAAPSSAKPAKRTDTAKAARIEHGKS